MQRNTLEDRSVQDKQQWDASVQFMEESLKEQLQKSNFTISYSFLSDLCWFYQK